MARARVALPSNESLIPFVDEEGRLAVRVTPGARTERLEIGTGQIHAKVRTKPEDGKATEAVRVLLATALELAPSRLVLLRGATSREKLFRILP